MREIVVEYRARDRFRLGIRGHELMVDQPKGVGGDDLGPTPTELFVAGLAGCIGFYAERYLRRHQLPTEGLLVECSFSMSEDSPSRVTGVDVGVVLPEGFPEERAEALLRVVDRCTVHNSLRQPPEVRVELRQGEAPEATLPQVVGDRT